MCKKLFLLLFLPKAISLAGQEWVSPSTPLVQTLSDFQIASPKGTKSPEDFLNYSESIFPWKLAASYPPVAGFLLSRLTFHQVSYRQMNTADKGGKEKAKHRRKS